MKRFGTAFAVGDPVWTWAAVSYDDLKAIMREEYGPKLAEVSEVLLQFGSNRFKKPSEMSVAQFTHLLQEQIPECMKPNSEAELRKFADLVIRALFYYCLDDHYIQKELCELDEADTNFKKYFDQACIAEQRRKSFQQIGKGAAELDPSGGISVSKLDTSGRSGNHGKSGGGGSFKSGSQGNQFGGSSTQFGGRNGGSSNNQYGGGGSQHNGSRNHGTQFGGGGGSSSNHFSGGNGGSSNQSFSGGGSFNYGGGSQQSQGKQFGGNFGGKKITCWHCGQSGHYAKRCPDKTSAKALEMMDDNQEDDNQTMSFHSLRINRVEVAASSSGVSRVPVNGGDKKFVGARRRRHQQQYPQQQQQHPRSVRGSGGGSRPPATPAAEQGRR